MHRAVPAHLCSHAERMEQTDEVVMLLHEKMLTSLLTSVIHFERIFRYTLIVHSFLAGGVGAVRSAVGMRNV